MFKVGEAEEPPEWILPQLPVSVFTAMSRESKAVQTASISGVNSYGCYVFQILWQISKLSWNNSCWGGNGISMVDFRFADIDKISEKWSGKALLYQGQLWKQRDFFFWEMKDRMWNHTLNFEGWRQRHRDIFLFNLSMGKYILWGETVWHSELRRWPLWEQHIGS